MAHSFDIVILGLTITSSWGNGHATTYRGLVRELAARGHRVTFLEHDKPWYAGNRDLPEPPYCRTGLYRSVGELKERFADEVRDADLVIVGSYVPEGVAVGEWACATARGATAFYDIDTPVTLAKLRRGEHEYLAPHLVPKYRLYLSFTGGPTLATLESVYGSPMARPLYCSADPSLYYPEASARRDPKSRFVVAGPQYPKELTWPSNVDRIEHLPPPEHRAFYNLQGFTVNVTRRDMVEAGYSPSVRLFEAAACGVPIVSDRWEGLDAYFRIGTEILVSGSPEETLAILRETPEDVRAEIGRRARERVLAEHTAAHRAAQLEDYLQVLLRKG
jgi:spore maturation protein CgeB